MVLGLNLNGQLGLGFFSDGIGSDTSIYAPEQVTAPARGDWVRVSAGAAHTCATRISGTLWCWGLNSLAQLGIGNHTDQDRPRLVILPRPAKPAPVPRHKTPGSSSGPRPAGIPR